MKMDNAEWTSDAGCKVLVAGVERCPVDYSLSRSS